jgi:hypothetical protein
MSNSEFRVEYQRNKPTKRRSYRIVREPGQRGFPTRQWPRSARSAEAISEQTHKNLRQSEESVEIIER